MVTARNLPARGPRVRQLGLALPPGRMPLLRRGRPLKRWRYVGVFGPQLMLCAGVARVGPFAQRWWAVALPDGTLRERTTAGAGGLTLEPGRVRLDRQGVQIDVQLDESGTEVEVVSPSGSSGYIWTRKRGGVPARGRVVIDGRAFEVDSGAVVDESAGYHERHTHWRWSAGVGFTESGRPLAWNLVDGVHDAAVDSERTLWIEDAAHELAPTRFGDDLMGVGGLRFIPWSAREHHSNMLLFRSDYRQPFGSFEGELAPGVRVADGWGVMEEHDAWW
ncbi:MAG: DUF2804 domain-containing protein [Thermoleophilaceae bacterium]